MMYENIPAMPGEIRKFRPGGPVDAFRAPATRWPEPAGIPEFGACHGCRRDDYLVTDGQCFYCSELAAERRRMPQPPPASKKRKLYVLAGVIALYALAVAEAVLLALFIWLEFFS